MKAKQQMEKNKLKAEKHERKVTYYQTISNVTVTVKSFYSN